MAVMRKGTKVGLWQDHGSPNHRGKVFTVAGRETYNGQMFYRLKEIPGGLFLGSSLYI